MININPIFIFDVADVVELVYTLGLGSSELSHESSSLSVRMNVEKISILLILVNSISIILIEWIHQIVLFCLCL